MNLENTLPLMAFLIVSFLAFYFVETIILFALNWLLRKFWVLVVDKLLRTVVHHRVLMRSLAFGSIAVIIILLFSFTPLVDLLVAGTGVFRLLALVLVIAMILIYLIGSRSVSEVVIEKRIHLYVFVVLSLLSFTGIMMIAQKGYSAFEDTINQAFLKPIVQGIEQRYEKRLEDRLLNNFRDQVKRGDCPYYDYSTKTGAGLTQFAFVTDDLNLAYPVAENQPQGEALAGKNCVLQTKFLLTSEGKWYQVVEQTVEPEQPERRGLEIKGN